MRAVCVRVQCACSVRASGGHLLHVSYPLRKEGALLHAPPSVELLGALLQQGVRDRATCALRQPCEVVRMALHLVENNPTWAARAQPDMGRQSRQSD